MINEKLVKIFNEEVSDNDNFSFKFKSGGELVFNKELEKKLDELNEYENLHFFSCVMGLMKGLIDIKIEENFSEEIQSQIKTKEGLSWRGYECRGVQS